MRANKQVEAVHQLSVRENLARVNSYKRPSVSDKRSLLADLKSHKEIT